MHFLAKPIPMCLSTFALSQIAQPTTLARALIIISKIPTYAQTYKEIKNSINNLQNESFAPQTFTK